METWLVMVAQLPIEDPAARMRVLRTLESLGAALLREGAYVLPDSQANRQSLDALALGPELHGRKLDQRAGQARSAHEGMGFTILSEHADRAYGIQLGRGKSHQRRDHSG